MNRKFKKCSAILTLNLFILQRTRRRRVVESKLAIYSENYNVTKTTYNLGKLGLCNNLNSNCNSQYCWLSIVLTIANIKGLGFIVRLVRYVGRDYGLIANILHFQLLLTGEGASDTAHRWQTRQTTDDRQVQADILPVLTTSEVTCIA